MPLFQLGAHRNAPHSRIHRLLPRWLAKRTRNPQVVLARSPILEATAGLPCHGLVVPPALGSQRRPAPDSSAFPARPQGARIRRCLRRLREKVDASRTPTPSPPRSFMVASAVGGAPLACARNAARGVRGPFRPRRSPWGAAGCIVPMSFGRARRTERGEVGVFFARS